MPSACLYITVYVHGPRLHLTLKGSIKGDRDPTARLNTPRCMLLLYQFSFWLVRAAVRRLLRILSSICSMHKIMYRLRASAPQLPNPSQTRSERSLRHRLIVLLEASGAGYYSARCNVYDTKFNYHSFSRDIKFAFLCLSIFH